MKSLQSVRGMHDLLPEQAESMQRLVQGASDVLAGFGYRLIQLPLIEQFELFARSVGEHTDVIGKEMYTLAQSDGDPLVLRPEGTAGCVRAAIQHGLVRTPQQRLWYHGPMFRHERPQKGRQRQFWQLGVEALGMQGVASEAELLLLGASLWRAMGLKGLRLEINHLGGAESRAHYRQALQEWLLVRADQWDGEIMERARSNPLRVLDSKDEAVRTALGEAPQISEFLSDAERAGFAELLEVLRENDLDPQVNTHLVRGLDYYTGVVFEWSSDRLGAQSAVCAGGRYDELVEQLGGQPTPCLGFALGWERVMLHLDAQAEAETEAAAGDSRDSAVDAVLIPLGEASASRRAILMANQLRTELPGLHLVMDIGGGNLAKKLRRADRLRARQVLLLGEDEMERGVVSVKLLYDAPPQGQFEVAQGSALLEYLRTSIHERGSG